MDQTVSIALTLVGLAWLAGFLYLALVFTRERERRGARIATILAVGPALVLFLAALGPPLLGLTVLGLLALAALVLAILLLLPIGKIPDAAPARPTGRYDERDIMFARARLRPGSPEYEAYYRMRPENRAGDDLTRTKPGLLSPDSIEADPFLFASAEASFDLTEAVREAVDGPVAERRTSLPVDRMTSLVKGLAKYYGALDVGIARIEPYHVYSHVGRGTGSYGEPIALDHSIAIAFTVEMDVEMIASNPGAPGVMESARQYVEAARVALQLAAYLRRLGHAARAHIDGNYRVIAPLVARDAGLGEIGRMGLLMTPRHGPRVRLGLVTTDLDLIPDVPRLQASVIDFCTVCKKCAESCPSRSIPFGDREGIDGAHRWRIDAETCYRYWRVAGTDCGVCMTVCPYSHPDGAAHDLIRALIRRSGFARRAALRLDDLFYGRKPRRRPPPDWLSSEPEA